MQNKFEEIGKKVGDKIDLKILSFHVFDDPKPKYVAKVTIVDRVLDVLFLWLFPQWVRPNYITLFRFISVPFIIFFILNGDYKVGFILFIISAFSDAIDGAIARTRNKITDWGIVFDPFADKLLIASVGGILIYKFLSPTLSGVVIFLELILIFSAYFRFKGEVVPAKTVGKLKMILQSVGVSLILLYQFIGISMILTVATYIIYLAILFALASILIYRSI